MRKQNTKDPTGSAFPGLPELADSTFSEWKEAKHRRMSEEEISMLNGIVPEACPYCGEAGFVKDGFHRNGIRKYRCRGCGRTFSPLTGTLFDSHRIPISEWFEYLMHLFEFHSNASSSRDNRNVRNTGKYWISKVFSVLAGCQDGIVLKGRVYLDETYFPLKPGDMETKEGKKLRGLSRNLVCVATAYDGHRLYMKACGLGKPGRKEILGAFRGHVSKGSTLVHDGERSHALLVRELGLREELHPTAETAGLPDSLNPMDPINDIHAGLKAFMRQHPSYRRRDLQDWLNLFWFVRSYRHRSFKEKAVVLIGMAMRTRKIIRYRDVFPRKPGN